MTQNYQIQNLAELDEFTFKLKSWMGNKAVLLLIGPLGVGKTKTVESLLRHLNYSLTSSPTFALHQQYNLSYMQIDHFDFYRIKSNEDLESVGFWDVFAKNNGWVLIEWPELVPMKDLPPGWPVFQLEFKLSGEIRIIQLTN
jgi:tRNA threonylcarbamoyladenosine biosynthesis protein TsaE